MTFGGVGVANPKSLLDNTPLEKLLTRELDLSHIKPGIDTGALRAIGISASGYSRGNAVTFLQGVEEIRGWKRARREGLLEALTVNHILASLSLPFMFPARRIGSEYFGDGSLRLTAPLSPAIRLGADRILIVGMRDTKKITAPNELSSIPYPTLGNLAGYMLDLIFMDNLDADIERLSRINNTLSLLDAGKLASMEMQQVRYFLALAEELDFTRASEKCNVTQPSLLRAIKLLEEELGGPLFNRDRESTHLRDLGQMVRPHLQSVYHHSMLVKQLSHDFVQRCRSSSAS